jgi:hypothetical protein
LSRHDQLIAKILWGASDSNIPFKGLCSLLRHLGFDERIRSSHHIFTRSGISEIVNVQPKGSKAKAYQVKQVRALIMKYKLGAVEDA